MFFFAVRREIDQKKTLHFTQTFFYKHNFAILALVFGLFEVLCVNFYEFRWNLIFAAVTNLRCPNYFIYFSRHFFLLNYSMLYMHSSKYMYAYCILP